MAAGSDTRLGALRDALRTLGLDGLVVPRYDEHQGEYIAPHDERLRFLTGFTGSAGFTLVLPDRAVMFVDGRYQVQVRRQVDLGQYEIEHSERVPVDLWLKEKARAGLRIGINPMLVPIKLYDEIAEALAGRGGELVPLEHDPIDALWADQPERPLEPIRPFSLDYAGEASAAKRARVAAGVAAAGADLMVEAQPDNIAWLLNVRGGDVANNPFPQSFLLLDRDGGTEWFVDRRKLSNDLSAYEIEGVRLSEPGELLGRIEARAAGKTVLIDPEAAPSAAVLAATGAGGKVVRRISPVTLAKALKNGTELASFRAAHLVDGAAWTALMGWLKGNVAARFTAGEPITELEVEDKVLGFRQPGRDFVYPSFRSISAAGTNAAMCHYASSAETNAPLRPTELYLLDSGGQYFGATRTLAFGPIEPEVRRAYTAVLKCFISLITLKFPSGTFGHQIDAFARRALWDLGLDYDHGAGHGVGQFLSVHENPHRFEQRANPYPLVAGLVMTIEPGLYVEDRFGMRIENQVELVDVGGGFVTFQSLTLAPIDLAAVDLGALDAGEIAFLDAYHASVRAALAERIDPAYRDYLVAATRPVREQIG
jgi:Xaa-Pro aminopeptidase